MIHEIEMILEKFDQSDFYKVQMYAITDIETTGGHASGNAITEIAICIHDGVRILREYHSLINPGVTIPTYITALTGIDNQMLQEAPAFEDIAGDIMEFTKDMIFVAHNVNFDFSFIQAALREYGYTWHPRKLCTLRLSRRAFPGLRSYGLGNLCNDLDIKNLTPHRALGDARAAAEIFSRTLKLLDEKTVSKMIQRGAGENFLPPHLDVLTYMNLPEKPGVYFMLNNKGVPVYIGKAINIKARIRSHFLGDKSGSRLQGFLKEVYHIEYQLTGNDLIALLVEDSQIRKHWPKYNQAQKSRPGRYGVFVYSDQKGFLRLAVNTSYLSVAPVRTFHSGTSARQWLLKLADTHGLDYRVLGIDLTDGNTPLPDREEHNTLLETVLEKCRQDGESCIFHSTGREPGERAFVWIERGKLKGFGFVPGDVGIEDLEQLQPYLESLPHSETTEAIVRSFLDDPRGLTRVPMNELAS